MVTLLLQWHRKIYFIKAKGLAFFIRKEKASTEWVRTAKVFQILTSISHWWLSTKYVWQGRQGAGSGELLSPPVTSHRRAGEHSKAHHTLQATLGVLRPVPAGLPSFSALSFLNLGIKETQWERELRRSGVGLGVSLCLSQNMWNVFTWISF